MSDHAWLSPKTFAAHYGVTRRTVDRWIAAVRRGEPVGIDVLTIGRVVQVRVSDTAIAYGGPVVSSHVVNCRDLSARQDDERGAR